MPIFDPVYVTEVLNDILGRRGLQAVLVKVQPDREPLEDADAKKLPPAGTAD